MSALLDRSAGVRTYRMLVGGSWREAADGATIASVDPFTGRTWATIPAATRADVDDAVAAAQAALAGPWGRTSATARGRMLARFADLVSEHADDLAAAESRDVGKLLHEARRQLGGLPDWYTYFAGAADKVEGTTIPSDLADFFVYTRREPVGVVAAITPWNSPLQLLAMKIGPALAAGCTVVVKPPEQASVSTLELAPLFLAAGFPPGVVNVVTGTGAPVGESLASHPDVAKVAFTGSTATGGAILRGASRNLAEVALELGGKSPNIVFADARPDALDGVAAGIFRAGGQRCVAGSRVLVQRQACDELVAGLVDRARAVRLGDPLDAATDMGPLAFAEHRDHVERLIGGARDDGATVACGGGRPGQVALAEGFFVEPTVLTDVDNRMAHAQAEIFGPVVSVIPFDDEEEAVRLANDTDFGLAAGVWTDDLGRAHRMAHALHAGTVWLNAYGQLSFTTPFSGFKRSGIGFEGGVEAVSSYTRTKAVWVNTAPRSGATP